MDLYAPVFSSEQDAAEAELPVENIDSFHWEKPGYSRPNSFFSVFAVEGRGYYAKMWSFEKDVRSECRHRDDPVYTDSCLEFFFMPVEGDRRYMNFEMNPNGVFLCEIGEKRGGRKLISSVTELSPEVMPFTVESDGESAWGVTAFLSDEFVSAVYGKPHRAGEGIAFGNFYKCADLSASPHFGAHFPVSSEALGFHNPDCFGRIIFRKDGSLCRKK